ncbi:SURF1-like protein [Pilimelia anulata]|uniref:SURF1-like protein n=1 Tax=Pilimelia anulata TaxID=53371 RepID=A0A8J3B3S0_9ACTN|nr:SURF1 family protein [Pilimelia anulata]GGJ93542.1 SURF1-like protein [Pilimelia anulata]
MYRFLASPRWLGYAAITLAASALMVLAGWWQYDRYTQRTATNDRIAAAEAAAPVPLAGLLPDPPGPAFPASPGAGGAGVGPAPAGAARWARATASGSYDVGREILVRGRTLDGERGFEVLTPLRLPSGAAVLVDRGWVAAVAGDARTRPAVPAAPTGPVTVVGRLAPPESGAAPPDRIDGRPEVRRIAPARLAAELPYPLYGGYLLRDADSPDPATDALVPVPSPRQRTWQNAGYVVQWWLFAAMAWVGFGWLARREARAATESPAAPARRPANHPLG